MEYTDMPVPYPPMTDEQVAAYLERLGIPGVELKPDLETLRLLHSRHLVSIPFENLDTLNHKLTSMDRADMFEKIIMHKRGGLCSENNGLFAWLLETIGFDVTGYSARTISEEDLYQPRRHSVNGVRIDGQLYLCDVGVVRESFRYPLKMEDGLEQTDGISWYRLDRHPFYGWLLLQKNKGHQDYSRYYGFTEEKQWLFDFDMSIGYTECHPNSRDAKANLINVLCDDCAHTLIGDQYWEYRDGEVTNLVKIEDAAMLVELLRDKIGIEWEPNETYDGIREY
ncbi:MAG: arylamine N-acetyltransferase [Eggerthellaceae bacterium]|nr:arylamine N-acetyltransferase [Eggerthellaceae bacterium]